MRVALFRTYGNDMMVRQTGKAVLKAPAHAPPSPP